MHKMTSRFMYVCMRPDGAILHNMQDIIRKVVCCNDITIVNSKKYAELTLKITV